MDGIAAAEADRGRRGTFASAVRPLLRRYGRQFARNGCRRPRSPEAHAGLWGGVLRPGGGLRSRGGRRRGAAGAGAVQEYLERRANRECTPACLLCRDSHCCPGRTERCDDAERIVEVSLAGARWRTAMNRTTDMTDKADPWSAPVTVAQIPDTGWQRDIEAGPAARKAMAAVAGLREILSANASLDVTPKGGRRVHVAGPVRARIGQRSGGILDAIEHG